MINKTAGVQTFGQINEYNTKYKQSYSENQKKGSYG